MNYLAGVYGSKEKDVAPVQVEPLEVQAFFVRARGAGNIESWPDILTVRASTSDDASSSAIEHRGKAAKGDRVKFCLRRDKPCCYVSTEAWSFKDRVVLSLCDKDDVWLQCTISPSTASGWALDCKMDPPSSVDGPSRWEIDLEVSLVGKYKGGPCFLSQEAKSTRKIQRPQKPLSLKKIDEDEPESSGQTSGGDSEGVGLLPDFSKQFEEAYQAFGGQGRLNDASEEDGEVTWFSAGLRVGVGVGLGICLGAGLGVGILVRSYQVTTNSLKRKFATL